VYADVLGDGINARYSVRPGRVKEDIILNAPSDFGGYAMDITVEGLTAVKAENNSVEFLNGDGEAVFVIQTPYVYDAVDDISYDINIEIKETAEGYRIAFAPDTEWLNEDERVYPVVIDPTVTSARALSNAYDTYIYDGSGNLGGLGDRMYVGIKSVSSVYKKHWAYWRVLTLPSLGSSYTITDASFIAQHPSGTSTSRPFSLYGLDGYWTEGTLTWANKPVNDTLLVSGVNRSNLTTTFSSSAVTQRVRDWYSGARANDGFMICYTDESLANPDYNAFWTCDGSTASYVPYISITYTVPTTSNVYYIRNLYYGNYLTASGTSNLSNVTAAAYSGGSNQKWELVSLGSNQYQLIPQNATSYKLSINPETNVDGNPIVIRSSSSVNSDKWRLVASGGGYMIESVMSSTGKVLEPSTTSSNVVLY